MDVLPIEAHTDDRSQKESRWKSVLDEKTLQPIRESKGTERVNTIVSR